MTTSLVINAVSTLLAAAGMGGYLVHLRLRARRDAAVEPAYVTRRHP